MIRYYLATVDKDFELTEEVKAYFSDREIKIVRFFKAIGILKLGTESDLLKEDIEFLKHIELDSVMYTMDDDSEE